MAYLVKPFSDSAAAVSARRVPDNDADLYRAAIDFRDVERVLRADPSRSGFALVAHDAACGASIYSRAVADCPMHLMRAEASLPFAPNELLAALTPPLRRQWDAHLVELRDIRVLRPPEGEGGELADVDVLPLREGERRVALQYLAVHSPIPLVQNREFEMVVAMERRRDGTAWVKALSTPMGYAVPMDPRQSRYVRALMLFSGILAQPTEGGGCRLSYVALVHPMGMLPAAIVNVVIGAQLTTLRRLAQFKPNQHIGEQMEGLAKEEAEASHDVTDTPPLEETAETGATTQDKSTSGKKRWKRTFIQKIVRRLQSRL